MTDPRRFAPSTERNAQPIGEILARTLPATGLVLEVASGSGEHAVRFAAQFPNLVWRPSDPDPAARLSITAHAADAALPNLHPPLALDAGLADWPIDNADAVICINMTHISPWRSTIGLIRGAASLLPPGGPLFLYGPYKVDGRHTADSNRLFDLDLRSRNPEWGLRDIEAVTNLAAEHGLGPAEIIPMPANNFSLVLRKAG